LEFLIVDVETANFMQSSICQIGLIVYDGNSVIDERSYLVNPETSFDAFNVQLHGIDEEKVKNEPTFLELSDTLIGMFSDRTIISHSFFDRRAFTDASDRYDFELPYNDWIDSVKLSRYAFPEFVNHKLGTVSKNLGFEFKHHDALEDSKAVVHLLERAKARTELSISDLIEASKPSPLERSAKQRAYKKSLSAEGNSSGPLAGEVVVFTGELSISRKEAVSMAAELGCTVTAGVTKKTTIVVVGTQNEALLAGHDKSSKHRKAEELMRKQIDANEQPLKIVSERDFASLLDNPN
jgi:DNA polymerase-3 subunit epsilon